MSDEYWTIVDVADDLSYIIFHYAGAAGAVGQVSDAMNVRGHDKSCNHLFKMM